MKNIIYSLVLLFAISIANNANAQTKPKSGFVENSRQVSQDLRAMRRVQMSPAPTIVYECGKSMKNIATGTVPRKGMVNDGTIRVRITNNVTSNYKLVIFSEGNQEFVDIVYNKVSGNLGFPILMYVSTLQDGNALPTGTINGIPVDNVSKSYNIRLDSSPITCPLSIE